MILPGDIRSTAMLTRSTTAAATRTVALVGARGHTGAELIRLIAGHPHFSLAAATSRELLGRRVADHVPGFVGDLVFGDASPQQIAAGGFDVVVLALPNGKSGPYVEAIDAAQRITGETPVPLTPVPPDPVIVDLSADWRFDETGRWVYGLPEHFRDRIRGAKRIANPGCYATGMQMALRPVIDLLDGPPHVFGVSGYSGAGTTPSPRNDPERLRDNLMPYSLSGHTHEKEVTRHLGRPVIFHPHVAPFFRGITLTVSMRLVSPQTFESLAARYHAAYDGEPLVRFVTDIPLVRDIAGHHHVEIGGLTVSESGRDAVVVATIDNLLKGAATQAIQNMNLACGFDEFAGIL